MGSWRFLIFLGIACGLFGFLILEASVVCAAPSFCGSPSGGSGKSKELLPDTRLCLGFYAGTPVRIKPHDEK
ncbi:MAG: hypothetical protein ACLURP_01630 [Ruminococcus sp.]